MKLIKKYFFEIAFFTIFVLSRLPNLGHDTFNTDVWKWKARIYDFGSGVFTLDFEKTIQKYHPGVTLMWVGTAAVKVFNLISENSSTVGVTTELQTIFGLHFYQKLFIVLSIAIVLCITMVASRRMFGNAYAVVFFTLLTLEPFYIALTREIHLEGLMSTFMLASFVWGFYYLQDKSQKRRLFLSALFGALSVLTKTSAVIVAMFIPFMLFLDIYFEEKKFWSSLVMAKKSIALWIATFVLFFVLLWPAMYTHASLAMETLYRGISDVGIEGEHTQLFLSKSVQDPGPLFYFVVLDFKTSIYFLLGIFGLVLIRKKISIPIEYKFTLYSLLFSLLYLLEITIPSKKLDRYVLPSIVLFLLAIAFFYRYLFVLVSKNLRWLSYLVFLIIPLCTMYRLHPDYFSYYSPLLGGISRGIYVLEPKWLIGEPQILEFLSREKEKSGFESFAANESLDSLLYKPEIEKKFTVGFQEKYYTQIWPFVHEIGARATINDLTPQAIKTAYFVYPVWDDVSSQENRFDLKYADSVYIRGVRVYNVYQRKGSDVN